jgi:hypothetical protein
MNTSSHIGKKNSPTARYPMNGAKLTASAIPSMTLCVVDTVRLSEEVLSF